MVDSAMDGSTWDSIPHDLLWRIVKGISHPQSWKRVASKLNLVNKHWRDAVRQYHTVLNPKKFRSFCFYRDAKSFSHFPNLQTIVLKHGHFWKDVFWVTEQQTTNEEISETIVVPMEEKLKRLKKLKNLWIEHSDDVEPFLSVFCRVCRPDRLYLKRGCLSEKLMMDMQHLTELKALRLECMDTVCPDLLLTALRSMKQLTVLEASAEFESLDVMHVRSENIKLLECARIGMRNFNRLDRQPLSVTSCVLKWVLQGRLNGDRIDVFGYPGLMHIAVQNPRIVDYKRLQTQKVMPGCGSEIYKGLMVEDKDRGCFRRLLTHGIEISFLEFLNRVPRIHVYHHPEHHRPLLRLPILDGFWNWGPSTTPVGGGMSPLALRTFLNLRHLQQRLDSFSPSPRQKDVPQYSVPIDLLNDRRKSLRQLMSPRLKNSRPKHKSGFKQYHYHR